MPEPQPFHPLRATSGGLLTCLLRFGGLLVGMVASACGLTLEWDANPEFNILGYKVHYGTESGQLTQIQNVGDSVTCVLDDLVPGTTYYFAVQAYNTSGLHSNLSTEISFTTREADSGVVMNSEGESLPFQGGEIQLGAVNPGAIYETRSYTFTNDGSATLYNLTYSLGGAASDDFRIVGDSIQDSLLASSLEPGESITFGIAFRPSGAGYREAFLKLASDQSGSALIEISLSGNGSVLFEPWLNSNGAAGGANGNPDGDALNNLFEYAFGTNPTAAQATTVAHGAGGLLASRGSPGVRVLTTPEFEFRGVFARRKDHAAVGLIYRPQFSADLNVWMDSSATPEVDGADDEIEAVSVKAPAFINGLAPRFFRVALMQAGKLSLPEWLAAHGTGGGANDNSDGDGLNNLFEFAFGTNPGKAQASMAAEANGLLVSRGAPTARIVTAPGFQFSGLFCRRKDRDAHGLIYMPQFSADLNKWVDSPNPTLVCADDGEIEVLSVQAPDSIDGNPARFFRVAVMQNVKPTFQTWLAAHGTGGGTNDNSDGDGMINLFEFAFGTDPAKAQSSMAAEADGLLMSRGAPTARIVTAPDFQFSGIFCRRKDRNSHGLIYTPQFSPNLTAWVESPYPPEVRADDGEIEVMSVRCPNSINGKPARFFRVMVSMAP